MDQKTIDEWESETPKDLPERIGPKKPKVLSTDDIRKHFHNKFKE